MTLRLQDITISAQLNVEEAKSLLNQEISKSLGVPFEEIDSIHIVKESLDARKKSQIVYRYQVDVRLREQEAEETLLRSNANLKESPQILVQDPLEGLEIQKFRHKPIIIGSGPAGIFAALTLARAGIASIVIERGESVEKRFRTTNTLRRKGELNVESNFCFGEGGAGTFSDGKLTCGRNHPLIRHVFSEFIRFGAPAEIAYEAHPHIGTDFLMRMTINMRKYLQTVGCEFLFSTRFEDFTPTPQASNTRFGVNLHTGQTLHTDHLILAIGHSARDTYRVLYDRKVAMVPKPFAMGVRVEHPQGVINQIQFGASCLIPKSAEYKLAAHTNDDRGIWTFCMCPGGHLLPTSAQEGHLAINGMSYHARKSGFANAALVVNVRKDDFFKGHVLDGIRFQETIERQAFKHGGGFYHSPAQRLEDFIAGRKSKGDLVSTYKPGVTSARIDTLLPSFITDSLRDAIKDYNTKMRGFISQDALIVGLESKTSAPVSILRNDALESLSHPGLFPAGEGAGFAGGIVSAALDGVKIGQSVLRNIFT